MRVPPFRALTGAAFSPLADAAARFGAKPRFLMFAALAFGLAGAAGIAARFYLVGLVLIAVNFLLLGLTDFVARTAGPTAGTDYLRVALDVVVAVAMPIAFALADPSRAFAATFLLLGFMVCIAASVAQQRRAYGADMKQKTRSPLTFHDLHGATGSGVVFLAFAVSCLEPSWFSIVAYAMGVLGFAAAGTWVAAAVTDIDS